MKIASEDMSLPAPNPIYCERCGDEIVINANTGPDPYHCEGCQAYLDEQDSEILE